MNLEAEIRISGKGDDLEKLFLKEKNVLNNERASFETKTSSGDFLIKITANDSTAFRAIVNTISKQLTVYEKTISMIENKK